MTITVCSFSQDCLGCTWLVPVLSSPLASSQVKQQHLTAQFALMVPCGAAGALTNAAGNQERGPRVRLRDELAANTSQLQDVAAAKAAVQPGRDKAHRLHCDAEGI